MIDLLIANVTNKSIIIKYYRIVIISTGCFFNSSNSLA